MAYSTTLTNYTNITGYVKIKLINSTTVQLDLTTNSAPNLKFYWEVIEFNNVRSLQTGDTASNSTPTINAVNQNNSMIFYSWESTLHSSYIQPSFVSVRFLSDTQISLNYDVNSAAATVNWIVIEFY